MGDSVIVLTGGWDTMVVVVSCETTLVTVEVIVVVAGYFVKTAYNLDSAVKKSVMVEVGAVL